MNGVLEGIERIVVESKDGELIATITEDEINLDPEYQVRLKPVIPKHKLFISCPMKGRTEENIKKSFEVMKRTAEAYTGETLEVVNPYEPKIFENDADHIRSLGDSIKLMADADYFITFENYFDYRGCSVENQVAALYGLKRVLAMTKLAAPDVLDKGPSIPVCDE
nr:MAG TPA: protein of unknown function (DUF4406) [Ackermannviridae sp.]